MRILRSLTELSHDILSEVLSKGDAALDCTAGNGNDTLFLANAVGSSGVVYSFDIQDIAIENTSKRMHESGLQDRVKLIKDSHENIDEHISNAFKAAVYNLGYMPGADHNITTTPASTLGSLQKVLALLERGGVVVLVVYYGHPGGTDEKDEVLNYVSKLEKDKYIVQKVDLMNMDNNPPILICIKKL